MAAMAALQYVFYGRRCMPQGAMAVVDGKVAYGVVCQNGPDDRDLDGLRRLMVLQRANVKKAKGTIQESVAKLTEQFGPRVPKAVSPRPKRAQGQ
jgi:hypothetical protein